MVEFGILIPLILLLGLGMSWLVLRRALFPQMRAKLPPSGARPWSRTRVPSPDSLGGNTVVANNVSSFIPLPKGPLLSDPNAIPTASGTLPTAPAASNGLTLAHASPNISPDAQTTSVQNSAPPNSAKYWKVKEEDLSLTPGGLPTSIQGGSLHGFTRYWKKREGNLKAAGPVSFSPEPSAHAKTAPLSRSENPVEGVNEDDGPNDTSSLAAASLFEKGLLTNAPYYTKLPRSEQIRSWEYE